MTRIVLLDDYQDVALSSAPWDTLGTTVDVVPVHEHISDADELIAVLTGSDAVVMMRERTPIDAALLDRLPDLRLIVTTGKANASLDVEAARERGIVVCGTRGLESATTEMTWALILSLVRQVPTSDFHARSGLWQRTVGADLSGSTLGIVGLGRYGTKVAAIGAAFGMDVIAWSQNLTPEDAALKGARAVSREELFSHSDVVSIHYKLGPRSVGLVGAPELALMKPSAYLVNMSRAQIVDTSALIATLEAGGIAGAGLDVFDEEPLPADSAIVRAPNTILTPHLGYVTRGNYEQFYGDACEAIGLFLQGVEVPRQLGT